MSIPDFENRYNLSINTRIPWCMNSQEFNKHYKKVYFKPWMLIQYCIKYCDNTLDEWFDEYKITDYASQYDNLEMHEHIANCLNFKDYYINLVDNNNY